MIIRMLLGLVGSSLVYLLILFLQTPIYGKFAMLIFLSLSAPFILYMFGDMLIDLIRTRRH